MKSEIRNPKSDIIIEILLILLLVFTPIAFGSQVLWAFSLMELGILLIIILAAVQVIGNRLSVIRSGKNNHSRITNNEFPITNNGSLITNNDLPITNNQSLITIVLISFFLGLVLFQMIPLPAGLIKILSPKTYALRNQLFVKSSGLSYQSSVNSSDDKSRITNDDFPVTGNESLMTDNELPITNNQSPITNHH